MDSYKSEPQRIACDINTIFDKLSSPTVFRNQIDAHLHQLPEEAKANLDKVEFLDDAIAIESPMGPLKLAVDHEHSQAPNRIVYTAAQSPVKFNLTIELEPISEQETQSMAALELDLPFFMKAMVNKQLEQAASKFGEMLAQLPYTAL
ncbi:MAG: hypothetical protein J5565_07105 [Muribaculaceae bacterium]|nr:hypothetical protein [Muribaculaceae bacterium]